MKRVTLLLFIILNFAAIGQTPGLFGSKNILTFKSNVNLFYSIHESQQLMSNETSVKKLELIDPVFEVGFERIVQRQFSIGLNYSFGFGSTSYKRDYEKIHYDPLYPDWILYTEDFKLLQSPKYFQQSFTLNFSFYLNGIAPTGNYLRTGIGYGTIGAKGELPYGNFTQGNKVDIDFYMFESSRRHLFHLDFFWGRNWIIAKHFLFNLEVGTRLNFTVDGKHGSYTSLFEDGIFWAPFVGYDVKETTEAQNFDRDLYVRKAYAELFTINLGFKIPF